jgi:CheY-like chemotaxis protein
MTPTILVVDDNKELVALLTSLFEDAGYAVVSAGEDR